VSGTALAVCYLDWLISVGGAAPQLHDDFFLLLLTGLLSEEKDAAQMGRCVEEGGETGGVRVEGISWVGRAGAPASGPKTIIIHLDVSNHTCMNLPIDVHYACIVPRPTDRASSEDGRSASDLGRVFQEKLREFLRLVAHWPCVSLEACGLESTRA
jgi:hypothetical protein